MTFNDIDQNDVLLVLFFVAISYHHVKYHIAIDEYWHSVYVRCEVA